MLVRVTDEASAMTLMGLQFNFEDENTHDAEWFAAAYNAAPNDDGTYDVDLTESFCEWVNGNKTRPYAVSIVRMQKIDINQLFEMAGIPLDVLYGDLGREQ